MVVVFVEVGAHVSYYSGQKCTRRPSRYTLEHPKISLRFWSTVAIYVKKNVSTTVVKGTRNVFDDNRHDWVTSRPLTTSTVLASTWNIFTLRLSIHPPRIFSVLQTAYFLASA